MSSTKVIGLLSSWEYQKAKHVLQVGSSLHLFILQAQAQLSRPPLRHVHVLKCSYTTSSVPIIKYYGFQELSADLPDHLLPPQCEPLMEFQWLEYIQAMKKV